MEQRDTEQGQGEKDEIDGNAADRWQGTGSEGGGGQQKERKQYTVHGYSQERDSGFAAVSVTREQRA